MSTLMEVIETYRCETQTQGEELIKKIKDAQKEGSYELIDYESKLKTKKSKGEIIDSWYIVKVRKKMETIYD